MGAETELAAARAAMLGCVLVDYSTDAYGTWGGSWWRCYPPGIPDPNSLATPLDSYGCGETPEAALQDYIKKQGAREE